MSRSLLFILMLMGCAMTVYAQTDQQAQTEDQELKKSFLYQWTDEKGTVQITDDLNKVPKQYRGTAIKLSQPDREDTDQGQQAPHASGAPLGADTDAANAAGKAMWQQRIKAEKQRLADTERRYRQLEQQRNELLVKGALAPIADKMAADDIAVQMQDLKEQMDEIQNRIDVVIPEEARQAGVPPGWLRE